jgi:TonB family protein
VKRAIVFAVAAVFSATAAAAAQEAPGVQLTLSQVVDSARLAEAVRAIPGVPTEGVSLYAVTYDSTGAIDTVTAMAVRDSAKDAEVVAAIRAVANRTQQGGHESYLFIRASWRRGPVLSTLPVGDIQPPQLQNAAMLQRGFGGIAGRFAGSLRPGGERMMLKIRVDQNGRAGKVTALRGTGVPEMDAAAIRVARQARFRPASVDGIPIASTASLPITIQPQQRSDPAPEAPRP